MSDTAFRPVDGVRVEVVDGPETGKSATSDSRGAFLLTGDFVRTETFRATKEGYVAATRPFSSHVSFVLRTIASPADLAGDYTLTFTADSACVDLPDEVRTRTYAATIEGYGRVSGATFLNGFHDFGVYIAGDYVTFSVDFDGHPWIVEELATNTYVAFRGSASTNVETPVSTISIPFDGSIDYCVTRSPMDPFFLCAGQPVARAHCTSKNHRLILTRR